MSLKTKPPSFCKNAIPTPAGWRDPVTNELLVAIKGLKLNIINEAKEVPIVPVIENNEKEVKIQKRGRPKKATE